MSPFYMSYKKHILSCWKAQHAHVVFWEAVPFVASLTFGEGDENTIILFGMCWCLTTRVMLASLPFRYPILNQTTK